MLTKKDFQIIKKDPILIFTLPLASIIFLLIIAIRPLVLIRFGLIHSDRLGHFSANTELFLCEQAKKKRKKNNKINLDFFYFPTQPCNIQLAKMIKRKLKIFPKIFCRPFCLISRKIKFLNIHVTGKSISGDYDVKNLYRKFPTQIKLSKEEIKKGNELLNSIGIKKKKIVLLIIRDPKYFKIHYGLNSKSKSHHDHRNDKIYNYRSAVLRLLKKDYFVIRMGNIAEDKLNINHKHFLDYPFSKIKSDFLDIFLAYKSYFCISNLTGYDGLITMFRKPLLSIGSMPIGCMYSSSENYFNTIYPHYSKKLKRNLTIEEIFNLNLAFEFKKENFDKNKITIKKHSPNEILHFVLEMTKYVENKSKFKNFYLNNKAIKIYNKILRKHEKKNKIVYNGKLYFCFSNFFLKKYKNLFY